MSEAGNNPVNPWVPNGKLLVTTPAEPAKDEHQPARSTGTIPATIKRNTTVAAWYATDRQRVDPLPPHRRTPVWASAVHPHLGGNAGAANRGAWWWLGVHGGAGVSSLMRFLPGGSDTHRWWPDPAFGGPNAVILVCRTHLWGLERARDAATQWAASDVPDGLLLAGAVAVADAPSRLDRPQTEALRLLEGVVPRLWSMPWLDELRCLAPGESLPLPPSLLGLRADLEALGSSGPASSGPASLGPGRRG